MHVLLVAQEFIDRTGFGNAVGLLQQMGMPGLQNLTSRAVDLDQLVKERAAEKAAADKAKGSASVEQTSMLCVPGRLTERCSG